GVHRRHGYNSGAMTESSANSRPTVLIVDDDRDIVTMVALTLQREGYRVLPAYDGASALRVARAERPALVILDWEMPGMTGPEVCRELRADADPAVRDVVVVMFTARVDSAAAEMGRTAGVSDYLT